MTLRVERWLKTGIAALITIPFVVPFLMLLSTSFRTFKDYIDNPGGLPGAFTLNNLTAAWTGGNLGGALISSFITCVVACVVAGLAALGGAYWFRIHQGRIVAALRWTLVAGWAIPTVAWLIPVFVILTEVGFSNSRVVTGVVDGVSSLPFALYLLHTFFRQVLSTDILEAATLDGATVLRTFGQIAVPLARPALAAVTALVFVWTFGDLLVAATLLQDPSVNTLTLATASLATRENLNLQEQAAAGLVAL
ncbi:MAG TPA: carbohydrate ABC transporter permease, partial [Chloroflexota bacterium]|nr:carbohydrate ABC transporter permease [Chloroflexota bacterium]